MERIVTTLFDFQHFQQNPKLASIVKDVESRYTNELSDNDLDLVNAAGENLPIGLAILDLPWEREDREQDDKHE